jgi:transcription elongation factor Elf1
MNEQNTKTPRTKKVKLGEFEFACPQCDAVVKKSAYCIAQQAMGNIITYSCKCGHKFEVPEG